MQWLYLDANQQQISAEEEQLGDLVQNGVIQAETMLWNETMSDWQTAQAIWPDSFQAAAVTVPRPHPPSGPPLIKRKGSKPAGRPASGAAARKTAKTRPKPNIGKTAAAAAATKKRTASSAGEEEEEINAATKRFGNKLAACNGWLMAVAVMSMILGSMAVFAGAAAMIGNPHFLAVIPIVLGVVPVGVSVLLMKAAGCAKLAAGTGFPENLDQCLETLGKYFVGIGIFLLVFLVLIVAVIALAIFSPGLFVPGG